MRGKLESCLFLPTSLVSSRAHGRRHDALPTSHPNSLPPLQAQPLPLLLPSPTTYPHRSVSLYTLAVPRAAREQ
jgi:hypothetical protein